MRSLVSFLLALLLGLSAAGHGALRLSASGGTQVVLCTGDGAVSVTLGPDGTPLSGPAHHCPDCLPLAALAPAPFAPPTAAQGKASRIAPALRQAATVAPVPRHPPARAPPTRPVA